MYEAPVTIYETAIQTIMEEREGAIIAKIQSAFDVDVDKAELRRALRYDRYQYEKGYADGKRDAMDELVRCKDCKHKTVTSDGMVCECALPTKRMQDYYIYGSSILARVSPDDFCSHGERKDNERKDD